MKALCLSALCLCVFVVVPLRVTAQSNDSARGATAYRARCAACHGNGAKGTAAGADLTELWAAGGTDQAVFQVIRRGIPNAVKAHSFGPDDEVRSIMAYLRTLNATTPAAGGTASNGERLFNSNCVQCHQVKGHGGRLGPDLSRVGASRSRAVLAH